MPRPLYVFSGLGADKRAFHKIDWGKREVIFIDWIPPHSKESLKSYVKRISVFIKHKDFDLLGLSFGGLIAQEIAKSQKPHRLILISSFRSKSEMPDLIQFLLNIPIMQRIAIPKVLYRPGLLAGLFGAILPGDKRVLKAILGDTDKAFSEFAIHAIAQWEGAELLESVRIHGEKDQIVPLSGVSPTHILRGEGSGHFMIANRAKEISQIIEEVLGSTS